MTIVVSGADPAIKLTSPRILSMMLGGVQQVLP